MVAVSGETLSKRIDALSRTEISLSSSLAESMVLVEAGLNRIRRKGFSVTFGILAPCVVLRDWLVSHVEISDRLISASS